MYGVFVLPSFFNHTRFPQEMQGKNKRFSNLAAIFPRAS